MSSCDLEDRSIQDSQSFRDYSFDEFISLHKDLIEETNDEVTSSIQIMKNSDENLNSISFLAKSIKVKWKNLSNAYMHIFIDTENIRRLEKQKAINKCQNIMLSSVSHEFRTPINAFSNALELLKMNFTKLNLFTKKHSPDIEHNPEFKDISERLEKYLKIGKITSKILIYLIEDILDLAKFEAGTFSTSESPFVVSSLIEDIDDIFSLQCKQKGLDLTIA